MTDRSEAVLELKAIRADLQSLGAKLTDIDDHDARCLIETLMSSVRTLAYHCEQLWMQDPRPI